MDLQVLRSGKVLVTARKWAGERFLPGMNSHMVDQLVLGLERPQLSRAVFPEASVVGDLRTADVLNSDVSDYLVKAAENLVARLSRRGLFRVDPHASHLLFDPGLAHVPKESPWGRMVGSGH